MRTFDKVALKRALTLATLMVVALSVLVGTAAASPLDLVDQVVGGGDGEHCVAEVEGSAADGELLLSEPRCYDHFALAMSDASDGKLSLALNTPGKVMLTDAQLQAEAIPFTIGIHYDGPNGTGSSIAIKGTGCTGGYWNTGSTWANRIESSYNGCYRLRHYDYPNKSGAQASTTGAGVKRNLPAAMANRTESVSYHGS